MGLAYMAVLSRLLKSLQNQEVEGTIAQQREG